MEAMRKYGKDDEFREPVLKCESCNKVVLLAVLKKIGMCPLCGNTKVRNVRTMTDEDQVTVERWIYEGKCDSAWLELFEPSEVNA
ncbi:MAG: hypothetical protein QMD11_02715 [Smithella sp.]|nr:hypothetical protein [Smithella sp.]